LELRHAGIALIAAAVGWQLGRDTRPALVPETRLDLVTPSTADSVSLAVSPDGRAIVFVATAEGPSRLWVRPSLNGAAATVLLSHFDDQQRFTLTTSGLPSREYRSITQARADGNNGRVWGGMHFPSTVATSEALGAMIADYVNRSAMLRLERTAGR
jgi:hypothetical protein